MPNLTIVLNIFRRWRLYEHQLAAIAAQVGAVTAHICSVLVVDCRNPLSVDNKSLLSPTTIQIAGRDVPVRVVLPPQGTADTGVWARFYAIREYVAAGELLAMFDDDTLPGPGWLQLCHDNWQAEPNLYVGCGVVQRTPTERRRFGWPAAEWQEGNIVVDWGGHAWFGDASWWHAALLDRFNSRRAGEDMALSFAAQRAQYDTVAPAQWRDTLSSSMPQLGRDRHALYRQTGAGALKVAALEHYRSFGWRLLEYRPGPTLTAHEY